MQYQDIDVTFTEQAIVEELSYLNKIVEVYEAQIETEDDALMLEPMVDILIRRIRKEDCTKGKVGLIIKKILSLRNDISDELLGEWTEKFVAAAADFRKAIKVTDKKMKLEVTVDGCTNLSNRHGEAYNPYVKVRLMAGGTMLDSRKTESVRKQRSPQWDETFDDFDPIACRDFTTMRIEVWNASRLKTKKGQVGFANIPYEKIVQGTIVLSAGDQPGLAKPIYKLSVKLEASEQDKLGVHEHFVGVFKRKAQDIDGHVNLSIRYYQIEEARAVSIDESSAGILQGLGKVGHGVKNVGQAAGQGVLNVGQAAGQGVLNMGQAAGEGVLNAGQVVGQGVVMGGKAVGQGVVMGGKAVGQGVFMGGKAVVNAPKALFQGMAGITTDFMSNLEQSEKKQREERMKNRRAKIEKKTADSSLDLNRRPDLATLPTTYKGKNSRNAGKEECVIS
mmetsp:Transcript_20910/g.41436  ORF Transcript_20910/g.41436 Transcript_20910/m.41436 type:complete len:448 (+) Transcript_20910:3-1346(+)